MYSKPPPLSTCLLPLLTLTDLPPPRSQGNPLEASQKCHFSTSDTHKMKCRVLTLALLTLSSHPHPAFPLPSFSPAFSIHQPPAWHLVLALDLSTAWSRFPLQGLTVLALTSFRLLPKSHVFRHHPYSPFILLCLQNSYPYMLYFINGC